MIEAVSRSHNGEVAKAFLKPATGAEE